LTVQELLLDLHFRASTGILKFVSTYPGGQFPKFRTSLGRLWTYDDFEKFFIIRYTDSFDEVCDLIRTSENSGDNYHCAQGFGVHRFNPEAGIYQIDNSVTEVVREILQKPTSQGQQHQLAFISSNSKDYSIAEKVYQILTNCGRRPFFAQKTLKERGRTHFSIEIDQALDESASLIIVASTPEMFASPWFDQEWRSWINELRSGRKSGNVMTVVGEAFATKDLPFALRSFETRSIDSFSSNDVTAYF
jgi:TIR domain-containing protein